MEYLTQRLTVATQCKVYILLHALMIELINVPIQRESFTNCLLNPPSAKRCVRICITCLLASYCFETQFQSCCVSGVGVAVRRYTAGQKNVL